jgi:hypothetical protein
MPKKKIRNPLDELAKGGKAVAKSSYEALQPKKRRK